MATIFKEILPAKGKKVRNNAFPHRPLDEITPTKVKWSTYWQRRLRDKEIVIVGQDAVEVVAVDVADEADQQNGSQAEVQESSSTKKSKKSKA